MSSAERNLDQAFSIAIDKKDYERALVICNKVIAENPHATDGLNTRARIYELMGNLDEAVKDISDAIDIDPNEPDFYFNRGRWFLGLGNYEAAIADQTKAIKIGKRYDSQYYEQSSLFFRAAAFLRLGKYEEALFDCSNLEEDFITFSPGIGRMSRAEIVNEAIARLNK